MTKPKQVLKAKERRKVPEAGTAAWRRWQARVVAGRRKKRELRHKAGLRTRGEIAQRYGVTYALLSGMVTRGELSVIGPYIHEAEAARVFGGGQSAA
jgi:hypothetical protein